MAAGQASFIKAALKPTRALLLQPFSRLSTAGLLQTELIWSLLGKEAAGQVVACIPLEALQSGTHPPAPTDPSGHRTDHQLWIRSASSWEFCRGTENKRLLILRGLAVNQKFKTPAARVETGIQKRLRDGNPHHSPWAESWGFRPEIQGAATQRQHSSNSNFREVVYA